MTERTREATRCSPIAMPSKRCYFHPAIRSSVFGLPTDAVVREQWLKFIFNSVPDNYNPNVAVCAAHFTEDSFQNLHQFNTGFTQRLLLKHGAVPTLKAEASVGGPQPVSIIWKCIFHVYFLVISKT